jgi:hypothetical protein
VVEKVALAAQVKMSRNSQSGFECRIRSAGTYQAIEEHRGDHVARLPRTPMPSGMGSMTVACHQCGTSVTENAPTRMIAAAVHGPASRHMSTAAVAVTAITPMKSSPVGRVMMGWRSALVKGAIAMNAAPQVAPVSVTSASVRQGQPRAATARESAYAPAGASAKARKWKSAATQIHRMADSGRLSRKRSNATAAAPIHTTSNSPLSACCMSANQREG